MAHGAYRIEPGTRSIDIFKRIARGAQTPVKLTFNNVRLLPQFAGRIAARLEADSASIISAIDSVLSAQGYKPAEYIGAFFPDTYEFYWTVPAGGVVSALVKSHDRFWTDERRAKASALGITPAQASVIASIAEEETNRKDERGVVARLLSQPVATRDASAGRPYSEVCCGRFLDKTHYRQTSRGCFSL